jgi:hypothetical protein
MKKTLTHKEIVSAFDVFANQLAEAQLGWRIALYISKNVDYLQPHIKLINEAEQNILEEFGLVEEYEENGEVKTRQVIPAQNISKFREERQELFNQEVDVEYAELDYNDLPVETREKLDKIITPKIMYGISYTIKE